MKEFTLIDNLLADTQAIPTDSILSQTLIKNEHLRVILFTFAAGQELSEHTASKPAVLQFLSGKARLTLGDETQPAEAHTYVYMAPNLPHSIYAETDVVMLLTMLERG